MITPIEVICRDLFDEFAVYLNYTHPLRFDHKPEYSYLRSIFRDLFVRESFQYCCSFLGCVHCLSEGNVRLYIYNEKNKLKSNQLGSLYRYLGINSDGSAWFLICASLVPQQISPTRPGHGVLHHVNAPRDLFREMMDAFGNSNVEKGVLFDQWQLSSLEEYRRLA